ncbi:MAG: hypothetical protein O7E54_09550, partial [Planctomycetota bacterium]|nr:hypothetical protein [Planctomycetota bacterium]
APIRAERPAQAGGRRSAPPRDERNQREDDWEDELPAARRYGKSGNDMLIIIGSVVLGAVLILVIVANMASGLKKDQHNLDLIETSREMKRRDQWKEALKYLQREVDTQGSAYNEVLKEMRLIESGMDDFYRRRDEEAARTVLSKVSRKIKAYNAGKRSHTPEDILKLVNTLKTKYPATESAKLASARYRAWFAGRVPDRASDVMRSSGQLLRDWQEAEDRSHEYVKKWEFRQARETIEIFLTAREAVLDQADLDKYREKVEQALGRVDSLADGRYRAQQRIAWNLEKKKRFDQAVKVYQEIIDKFGIDLYRRKAQEEINKIKGKRRGG